VRSTATVFFSFKGAQESIPRNQLRHVCIMAGRYDNPIPTGFLVPTDCSKIPAQSTPSVTHLHCMGLSLSQLSSALQGDDQGRDSRVWPLWILQNYLYSMVKSKHEWGGANTTVNSKNRDE
jgi:hypothetical protein